MPRRHSTRWPTILGRLAMPVVAVAFWLGLAVSAFAHASLTRTEPADGAVLDTPPPTYTLSFSEPVSPMSLKLVRTDGSATSLDRFELKDRTVEIAAPAELGRGTHILSWRVVSEDGHPIGGSVVFSIGEASGATPHLEEEVDWIVRTSLLGGKIALYVGLFAGVGGAFALGWLMRGSHAGRGIVAAALGIGLFGAIASAGVQGLDALGADIGRLLDPTVWWAGMGTSFGRTVITAVMAFGLAAIGFLSRGAVSRPASLIALLLAGAAFALSGHASAADPQWLMRPMVFLHGVGIAFWAGALIPLGLALRRGEPPAASSLGRFSAAIPYVVAMLLAAGLVLAVVQVERPDALFDTAYGRVFLVKLGLVAGLFILAAINRWRLTAPAKAGVAPASRRLARSIAAETAIVLLILAVAACWRFTPPPRALAIGIAEPTIAHIHTGKAIASVSVEPGRAGVVDVSIALFTSGWIPLEAKEVTLYLARPEAGVEPLKRAATRGGDAGWRVEDVSIPLAGLWQVRVDVLISDFEIIRLEDGALDIAP